MFTKQFIQNNLSDSLIQKLFNTNLSNSLIQFIQNNLYKTIYLIYNLSDL
jgi:hypothetical protein